MQVLSLCNQINIAICSFFWEPEERKRRSAYAQQNKDEKGKKSEKKEKKIYVCIFLLAVRSQTALVSISPFTARHFDLSQKEAQDPGAEAAKLYLALIDCLICTCAFPTVTCQNVVCEEKNS